MRALGVRILALTALGAAFTVACGGTSVRHEPGSSAGTSAAGTGADGGSGGKGSGAVGGSSAGGTGAKGGTAGKSGSSGKGGSSGSAGSNGTGATGGGVRPPCLPVACPDGQFIEPSDCGCPVCSCEDVGCSTQDCPAGQIAVRPDGACCDVCVDEEPQPGCEAVTCEPEAACPSGQSYERPPGACCAACVWTEPPSCLEIACPPLLACPRGYVQGNGYKDCCYQCVPDPDYCESDADCLFATQPGRCCSCAEAISQRHYDEDPCYSSVKEPRPVPEQCITPTCVDSVCPCSPPPNAPACAGNHCVWGIPL